MPLISIARNADITDRLRAAILSGRAEGVKEGCRIVRTDDLADALHHISKNREKIIALEAALERALNKRWAR